MNALPPETDTLQPPSADRLWSDLRRLPQVCRGAEEYFAEFLPRVTQALKAVAGGVWMVRGDGAVRVAESDWEWTGLELNEPRHAFHRQSLKQVFQDARPLRCNLPPRAKEGPSRTEHADVAIMAPVRVQGRVAAVVEVFEPVESSPLETRTRTQQLLESCRLAEEFLTGLRLGELTASQEAWIRWEELACAVGARTGVAHVAGAIAASGRNLIDCHRLSVLAGRGHRLRTVAISGVETVDRRSSAVRKLEHLARQVAAAREPVWCEGDPSRLPSQLASAFREHFEASAMRMVGVWPLLPPAAGEEQPESEPIGALVVEFASGAGEEAVNHERWDSPLSETRERAAAVARLAGGSLATALAHDGLFLGGLWRGLGTAVETVRGRRRWQILAASVVVTMVALALWIIPADLEVEGPGTLQPCIRRNVYCQMEGQVERVLVEHGSRVEAGQLLAVQRNLDLETQLTDLKGEQSGAQERLEALNRLLLRRAGLEARDRGKLHGERIVLMQSLENLERQAALLHSKQRLLEIRSPIAGQIVTWNLADRLQQRPLRPGELLCSIVEPEAEWELEIRLPEEQMGMLSRALLEHGPALAVRLKPANQPEATLQGSLREVHGRAELHNDGSSVLLCVALDRSSIGDPRPGAEATARVQCGRRALGYVWFRDVWAFVQGKILFRLR